MPPIIFDLLRKSTIIEQDPKSNPIWSGDYKNWEEAQALCIGYDSDIILEKCKSALLKVKNGEAVYERDSVIFDQIYYSFGLLAGLERAALENSGELTVLDFGGSLGSSYFQNKEFLKTCNKLNWCIVEQTHFVDCGKQYFEDGNLKFFHSIQDCLTIFKPNVLLISGVLQYLDKPYELLTNFLALNIPYIIIDRTAFVNSNQDILTIQNVPDDIYKASYPAWFFAKNKFEALVLNNYKLISYFDSGFTPPTQINGKDKVYWNGLILKK